MRKIEIPNPISYFEAHPYSECLVLSICVSEADKVTEIVCEFFDLKKLLEGKKTNYRQYGSDLDQIKEFHRISFSGVSNVLRKNTTYRHGFREFDADSLDFGPGAQINTVINYVTIKKIVDGFSATVACHALGDYTLHFKKVSVDAIQGRPVKVGYQQWEYYDVETGLYIDFKQPFGLDV